MSRQIVINIKRGDGLTAGRILAKIMKKLMDEEIEVIDLITDQNEGTLTTPKGKVRVSMLPSGKFNFEIGRDRVYLGVRDCSEEEIEANLKFLLQNVESLLSRQIK